MPVEVVNRDRSAPFLTKDRSEIRSILDGTNSTAMHQSLAEATLPPGAETEEHLHPRTEEIYYVLRGRGLMSLGDERREVGPGDGILIPPGTRHWSGRVYVSWNRVTSGGAFSRIGVPVVPMPRLTYRWEVLIRYRPSG